MHSMVTFDYATPLYSHMVCGNPVPPGHTATVLAIAHIPASCPGSLTTTFHAMSICARTHNTDNTTQYGGDRDVRDSTKRRAGRALQGDATQYQHRSRLLAAVNPMERTWQELLHIPSLHSGPSSLFCLVALTPLTKDIAAPHGSRPFRLTYGAIEPLLHLQRGHPATTPVHTQVRQLLKMKKGG